MQKRAGPALTVVAGAAAPLAIGRRYELLLRSLVRLRRSRRGRWGLGLGYGVLAGALALLAVRHFARSGWPLAADDRGG